MFGPVDIPYFMEIVITSGLQPARNLLFALTEEVFEGKADPSVALGREAPLRFLVMTTHESNTLRHD